MSEPVVVNTGPLLWLGHCGQIELLRAIHVRVLAPRGVLDELCRLRRWPPAGLSTAPAWLEIAPAPAVPPDLASALDEGEAQAIALALERGIRLVAIDEAEGRRLALARGLALTGSVGILVRAKRSGLLALVKPSLDAMRAGGAWLGDDLVRKVLRDVGEG